MTDSNPAPDPTSGTPQADTHAPKRRWRWARRALLGGAVVALLAGMGAWFGHAQHPPRHWHHAGFHAGSLDAEDAVEWAQFATQRMLRRIDATPEQKTRIDAIVAAAVKDLLPMREQGRRAREDALRLVAAPQVDRDAIETMRAAQIDLHDRASRRLAAAIGDIAEVLTPAQREALAKAMLERRWGAHR